MRREDVETTQNTNESSSKELYKRTAKTRNRIAANEGPQPKDARLFRTLRGKFPSSPRTPRENDSSQITGCHAPITPSALVHNAPFETLRATQRRTKASSGGNWGLRNCYPRAKVSTTQCRASVDDYYESLARTLKYRRKKKNYSPSCANRSAPCTHFIRDKQK